MKDTNPKDAIGTAKWRQFMVVPRQVLWEVGVGMLEGALKYGRHNYRAAGVRASVYCDAAMGHIEQFIEGEDIDKDSGLSHVTKAICSLVVLRDAMMNDFWTDDRPPKIKDLDELREFLQAKVVENFERYADKDPHHYTETEDGAPYRAMEWPHGGPDLPPTGELYPEIFGMPPGMKIMATEDPDAVAAPVKGILGDDVEIEHAQVGDVSMTTVKPREPLSASEASILKTCNVGVQTDPDFREAARLLRDPTWLPGPLRGLFDDDPRQLLRLHPDDPAYDVDHIVEGLTWKQLDHLVADEAQKIGLRGLPAGDEQLCDALLRRVLVRIKDRPVLRFRLDFPTGGTSVRETRLTMEDWHIAVPGVRVTPLSDANTACVGMHL